MITRFLPLAFAGCALLAQGPHGLGGHGPSPLHLPLRALNLTEAQKTSVHQILDAHKPAMAAKTAAARDARRALVDAVTSPATSEAQLKTLHDAAAAAQFEVLKEGRAIFLEVDPLLTPEQRTKAHELKDRMRSRMDHFRGMVFGE